jgi:hypothetical protein
VKRFFFLTILLFLAACGSAPRLGEQPLDQQRVDELKFVGPYLASSLVNGLRQNSSPSTSLLRPAQASGDCGPSIATLTDNDNDDIPASYNATFRDCTEVNALVAQIKNGNVTVTDADDNNPNSGLTSWAKDLRFDLYTVENNQPKDKFLSILDNWDVTVNVTSSSASVDYFLSVGITSFKNNQVDKTWQGSLDFTGSYVAAPDNDLNNFDAGTINFDGQLILGNFVSRAKITNLVFDETCKEGPKGGTIRFDDGTRGNFFEITYTSCNKGTFTYNSSGAGTF